MQKLKVLVTAAFSEKGINELKKTMDVEYCNWMDIKRPFTQEELLEMVKDKDILIMEMGEVHKEVIEAANKLKIIACCRGLRGDSMTIDIPECNKRNIPILLAPGRNLNAVAEFTILLTLGIMRKVRPGIKWFYEGNWKKWLDFYTTFRTAEISGRQVGLLGFGNIGKRVAKLYNAFGAKVVAYDPYVNDLDIYKEYNVQKVDLEQLLKTSDIVSLHMNVSDETKAIVGEKEIKMMKSTAFLINSARAAVIDHDALFNALKNNKLAGAAMDVYHNEPTNPDMEPLLNLENVFATPHLGGTSNEVIENHSNMVIEDLKKILNGEDPKFIINQETLTGFKKAL